LKFGANAFIWSERFDRSHIGLLERLKKAGFDGIELPLIDPDQTRDSVVREALQDCQLEPTFCSVLPPGLSPISDDSGVRQRTTQHYQRCIETAAEMGGSLIAGPLYAPVGYLPGHRRTADEWKRAVECFQQLGPALAEHSVTLAIEPLNRYETYFLNTAADAARLCSEVGHARVGILFDTYHANIEEKHLGEAIVMVGQHLRHFHSCENDRGVPGSGHIDWPGVFAGLRAVNYDGWLTIESFGFSLGMLSAAASVWRDLAPTAETIAFDGLKFLREASAR
jgi:D-psicose/D-tagatose/L-ribulose 3-epimerase